MAKRTSAVLEGEQRQREEVRSAGVRLRPRRLAYICFSRGLRQRGFVPSGWCVGYSVALFSASPSCFETQSVGGGGRIRSAGRV